MMSKKKCLNRKRLFFLLLKKLFALQHEDLTHSALMFSFDRQEERGSAARTVTTKPRPQRVSPTLILTPTPTALTNPTGRRRQKTRMKKQRTRMRKQKIKMKKQRTRMTKKRKVRVRNQICGAFKGGVSCKIDFFE